MHAFGDIIFKNDAIVGAISVISTDLAVLPGLIFQPYQSKGTWVS
jgi:phage portal protein BeeE